ASLGCWSLGMKFSMVLTLDTSGTLESFSTSAWAASLFGASTKIELAPMAGSLRNSRNVATDSTRGFLRLSGLKSNCRCSLSCGRRVSRKKWVSKAWRRRWNQRDAGQECDDHAEARKQAELG